MYLHPDEVKEDIDKFTEALVVKDDGDKIVIVTAFTYPDGDHIELYMPKDVLCFTDGGNTISYIRELDVPLEKIEPVIDRIAKVNSVRYKNGELMVFSVVMIPNLINVCFAVAMLRGILGSKEIRENLKEVIEQIE